MRDISFIGVSIGSIVREMKKVAVPTGVLSDFSRKDLVRFDSIRERIARLIGKPILFGNDGDVEGLGIARGRKLRDALILKFGTSLAATYIQSDGRIGDGINEFTKAVINMDESTFAHYETRVKGCAGSYISWTGICNIAQSLGLDKKYGLTANDPIPKILRSWLTDDTTEKAKDARKVFEKVGEQVANLVITLGQYYQIEHILFSGGIVAGRAGEIIVTTVHTAMHDHGMEIARVEIVSESVKYLRFGFLFGLVEMFRSYLAQHQTNSLIEENTGSKRLDSDSFDTHFSKLVSTSDEREAEHTITTNFEKGGTGSQGYPAGNGKISLDNGGQQRLLDVLRAIAPQAAESLLPQPRAPPKVCIVITSSTKERRKELRKHLPSIKEAIERSFPFELDIDIAGGWKEESRNRIIGGFYDSALGQYILPYGSIKSPRKVITLVVTDSDLTGFTRFGEVKNFLFGRAYPYDNLTIISTYRFRHRSDTVTRSRLVKNVLHELGHLFGLGLEIPLSDDRQHCAHPTCAMRYSADSYELDRVGDNFCPTCMRALAKKSREVIDRRRRSSDNGGTTNNPSSHDHVSKLAVTGISYYKNRGYVWADKFINDHIPADSSSDETRDFIEAVQLLAGNQDNNVRSGARWIIEELSRRGIISASYRDWIFNEAIAFVDSSTPTFTPLNISKYDGVLYNALKKGWFNPGDEGKVAVTALDPFTARFEYTPSKDFTGDFYLRLRAVKDSEEVVRILNPASHFDNEAHRRTTIIWNIDPSEFAEFLSIDLMAGEASDVKESGRDPFTFLVGTRSFKYIDKITPESVAYTDVQYKPAESLSDKKIGVFSMEATLLMEDLHGAMGGGLGILMGSFVRALAFSGGQFYFALPIYRYGVKQNVVNGLPELDNEAPLDYDILFRGYQDELGVESWEKVDTAHVRFSLEKREVETDVVLMKLTIKGALHPAYVLFVELTEDIAGQLYPSQANSYGRFMQAAFYGRATLEAYKAFDITLNAIQMHESFPAVSVIPDLFCNEEYMYDRHFNEAKRHIMGFAHTVVPQAFPWVDRNLVDAILGLDHRKLKAVINVDPAVTKTRSLLRTITLDGQGKIKVYDPFYALSEVAQCVGTVGLEHLDVMQKAFSDFADKYFAIEDSIWPFFWMLKEQIARGGALLSKPELWEAKERAEDEMLDYIESKYGRRLRKGRPTIVEARRFTDFKWNTFFAKMPGKTIGEKVLNGIYYLTADPQEGGLGFNLIIGGKAHESDDLCQWWVSQLKELSKDPDLKDRFLFSTWTPEDSVVIIRGAKVCLQTSIPPYEAAGMKDKKDEICGNVVVSSYTGGPVQQVTNVLHYGTAGNGYVFEPFDPERLQEIFEDLSARFYAHINTIGAVSLTDIGSPNDEWNIKTGLYMETDPHGILDIMHNATKMLPVVDSRTAAMKFAFMYSKMLGVKMEMTGRGEFLDKTLKDFSDRLRVSLEASSDIDLQGLDTVDRVSLERFLDESGQSLDNGGQQLPASSKLDAFKNKTALSYTVIEQAILTGIQRLATLMREGNGPRDASDFIGAIETSNAFNEYRIEHDLPITIVFNNSIYNGPETDDVLWIIYTFNDYFDGVSVISAQRENVP
ncbi:MAG: hypothetical protein PHV68_07450, partial [Candidatus Gastranaerophilales bacterium]|nr:hypothetical protein [Candidatus Gastranaerophilales bacterium]